MYIEPMYMTIFLRNIITFYSYITLTVGRQPVVSMIESALGRCTADWKEQNAELNTKLDLLLDLQRQRLTLDEKRLEFEREMAGLGKVKEPTPKLQNKMTKAANNQPTRKRKKGT